jgi:hypothetical protein
MRRLALFGFIGALAAAIAGCPIYDDDDRGGFCDGDFCDPPGCQTSSDCGINETCGADDQCHTGDCSSWGCPDGQSCVEQDDNTVVCEGGSSTGSNTTGNGGGGGAGATSSAGGGTSTGSAGGGGTGGTPVYCGNPDDCAATETCGPDGTCQAGDCAAVGCIYGYTCDAAAVPPVCKPTNPAACGTDSDCAGAGSGYACVSGICTAPGDQCFDQTQCPVGNVCAGGKCTTECADNADCSETSYTCDAGVGICSVPANPCTITNDCGGPDAVCVDGACVPRSDMGSCPAGHVWVENGCIPNQSASFICTVDGAQDLCADGSICLHHSCYISCAPPNQTACDNLPSIDQCKTVTTTSGAHDVCASSDNLGGECDPTAGLGCAPGKICIDGFCK